MNIKREKKVLFFAVIVCGICTFFATNLYAEEQCLKDAWKALNTKKYADAIKLAEICIDKFGKKAGRIQKELNDKKVQEPPTGGVNDAEKNRIFKQGLLNDVAAAYFIKGRSAEYLYSQGGDGRANYKEMAVEAYQTTCIYKHGRVWDPRGWFWSPCESASDRLPINE